MFENTLGIVTIIAIICAFYFSFSAKKKEGKDKVYAIYFIIMLFSGIALYSYALFSTNDNIGFFTPFLLTGYSLDAGFSVLQLCFGK